MGLKIIRLNDKGNSTDNMIVTWTRQHSGSPFDLDSVVAIDFNVGGYVRFSNSLFSGQVDPNPNQKPEDRPALASISWDPPGEEPVPRGPSQHTQFDGGRLSARDEGYQLTAVDWFVDFALSSYLTRRHYFVDPTEEVMALMGEINPEDESRLPKTPDDIMALVQRAPHLINSIRCDDETFTPDLISPALRQVCRNLLDSQDSVTRYVKTDATGRQGLISEWEAGAEGGRLTEREVAALTRAAEEKPDLLLRAQDSVELGRARGDENTYILIGTNVDPDLNLPVPEGVSEQFAAWYWVMDQLDDFVEANGFVPAFGPYVTEARMRYRVVLGPGTGERERNFLQFYGHDLIDRTQGGPIGRLDGDETDSQQ
jgi:hypothetical protein